MKYTQEQKDMVMDEFLNNKDNSTPSISRRTGLKRSFINGTIDRYFKSKGK